MRYGQNYIFAMNLNKEFGYDKADELLTKSREIVKHSTPELLDKIEYYNEQLKNM